MQGKLNYVPIIVSVFALIVSGLSWREAHEARNLNYLTSLPALTAKAELREPIKAGKPIVFKVTIKNHGRSFARKLNPEMKFLFSPASIRFQPNYSPVDSFGKKKPPGITSELNPGDQTTFLSDPTILFLPREQDVEAVTSGRLVLYLYGRVPYFDLYDKAHELHFCSYYYQPPSGAESPVLTSCDSYNETV